MTNKVTKVNFGPSTLLSERNTSMRMSVESTVILFAVFGKKKRKRRILVAKIFQYLTKQQWSLAM